MCVVVEPSDVRTATIISRSLFLALVFCVCAAQRIFFVSSGSRKGRLSPTHALSTLVKVFQMLVAILLAAVLCLVVYPLLSILLWLRGFGNILHYVKQMYKKTTRWERRQVDLGEEEEWSVARTHAIRRNRRYATANSSENEFNVDALLKTTTGMTMEDLRQKMVDLKSARRRMALTASLDAVLSQFPSDDKVRRVYARWVAPRWRTRVCYPLVLAVR